MGNALEGGGEPECGFGKPVTSLFNRILHGATWAPFLKPRNDQETSKWEGLVCFSEPVGLRTEVGS